MVEFEYLRLRCQGSSRSRYQAGIFEGEGGGGKGEGEREREIKGKEWKRQSEVIQLLKPKN